MSELFLDIRDTGIRAATIEVGGKLEANTYDELVGALTALLDEGVNEVELDLGGLDRISSTGIGVFIELLDMAASREATITFARLSPKAKDIFALVGILTTAVSS